MSPHTNPGVQDPSKPVLSMLDAAVDLAQSTHTEIDWKSDPNIKGRTLASTLAWLASGPGPDYLPDITEKLLQEFGVNRSRSYSDFIANIIPALDLEVLKSTEFILRKPTTRDEIWRGFKEYQCKGVVLSTLQFLLIHKPCCRLHAVAWQIPAIAAGVPCIGVVTYAAEFIAALMNHPTAPFRPDCTPVGNSWFHRLGVYLLDHCASENIPPPHRLVRLMAMVSPPPSQSVKKGKAERMLDVLEYEEYPKFLHESPPAISVGNYLALELIGEIDANRQQEHFRRIERAVAYYAVEFLKTGQRPSAKKIQEKSGLSWADAKNICGRPYFIKLVFEYQCRYLYVTMESSE